MAAFQFDVTLTDYALAATTQTTALQIIAASTNKVRVGGVGESRQSMIEVSFDGVTPTNKPVLLEILRQTTSIGGTPTTVTPVKRRNGESGTLQTTARKKTNSGDSEPTASDIYAVYRLHPQGRHVLPDQFIIEQGDRLGFRLNATDAVNVSIKVPCEE